MITLNALTAGLRSTNKSFRIVLLLYVSNFLIAAILAWGLHSILASTLGDSMSLERLVKDFDATVYSDFMFKDGSRIYALLSQLTWLILFYSLINTLLGGGTIAALKNEEGQFSLRVFFENCGMYFFRFLRLFLIFGAILALSSFTLIAIFGVIYSMLTSNAVSEVLPFALAIILFLFFLFVVMIIVMMADYAKVATVASDAKSMLKTTWKSIKFVFRHFLSTVGLQLSIIVILVVAVIFYLLIESKVGMATPFTILLLFLIQQASVGFKVYTRVLTFAGELELFKTFESEAEEPIAIQMPTVSVPSPIPVSVPPAGVFSVAKPAKKKPPLRRPPVRRPPPQRKRPPRKSR